MEVTINGKLFSIWYTPRFIYSPEDIKSWSKWCRPTYGHSYYVSVRNEKTGKSLTFVFHNCIYDARNGKEDLTDWDLMDAVENYVSGALLYRHNHKLVDFMRETATYHEGTARRYYAACKNASRQVNLVFSRKDVEWVTEWYNHLRSNSSIK